MTVLLMFAIQVPSVATTSPPVGRTSEEGLRDMAVKTVRPTYPIDALRNHATGIVVVDITIGIDGKVSKYTVLEAPSTSLAESVSTAVLQWEFKLPRSDKHGVASLAGKLTFYCVIRADKGFVLNPSETGYVGRWPPKSRSVMGGL